MRTLDDFCIDFDHSFIDIDQIIEKEYFIANSDIWFDLVEKVNKDSYASFCINDIILEDLI